MLLCVHIRIVTHLIKCWQVSSTRLFALSGDMNWVPVCFSELPHHGLCCLTDLTVVQVVRFPEAVEAAVEELMPNRITDYLYDLSEKFNGFYTECHVRVMAWQNAHICAASHLDAYGCIFASCVCCAY